MKKTLKRTLATFLTVIMLFSALPLGASAATVNDLKYFISDGKVTITDCNESASGELVIPSKIDGYLVTRIGECAFSLCKRLTKITIPNSVTSIGNYAFEVCDRLTTINIPNNVTSIAISTFYGCQSLTNITIPNSVTSISEKAFEWCTSLTNITIPNSVTSIEKSAFHACKSLKNITVDKDNKYYCNDEYGVLYNKNKTELLLYPAGNARTTFNIPNSVNSIGDSAFFACYNLTNVTIPNSVTTIKDGAFQECTKLTNITIPNSVTSIDDDAFFHCDSLTNITIPSSVENIGYYVFYYCLGLKNVTISKGIKSICCEEFGECHSLTSITIPSSVTSIDVYAFNRCNSLTDVYYNGTEEQWNKIEINEEGNECLLNATIHYNATSIYTVTYNANGGTVSPTSATVESGKSVTLPTPNARTGYTCLGWSTGKTATSATYSCGASYKPTANVTLYAVWKQNPIKYTVTFNGNGGTVSPTSTIVESGKSITLPTPNTRTGYTCLGWSTSKTATSATYSCGASHKPTSNVTLYAVWKQNPTTNIYNIGEETYSFKNYSDRGSTGGHCFGMSITSAGYYLGMLNPSTIGIGSSDKLYSVSDTNRVREPICYYQHIQGNYTGNAIVAGTTTYYNAYYNAGKSSRQCWNECVDYVKSHNYDNKGTLQIQFWKTVNSGHAVNFLYYKNVNGQDRLYVYDNNYPNPDSEVYLYLGNNGKIYEAPKATYGINTYVETICLVDMNKYFQYAKGYNPSSYIFAKAGSINVEGAIAYPMACGEEEMFMYEIPDFAPKITIKPLINNAEFEYMEEAYNFNKVDNDTYGVLSMPAPETSGEHSSLFKVFNEPNALNLKDIELKYKDTAKITPNFNYDDSGDYTVKYESSDTSVATVDKNGNISTIHKGTTTITCTVTDEYGNTVKDTCTVTVKFQWWQWLIWILLFGFLWY